jgi:tetratricopeptide (TPR) repeat protein
MRSTFTAIAVALMAGTLIAAPASAQTPAPAAAAPPQLCSMNLSNGARKALLALQTVVDAKNNAGFAAADAAARAAVKNGDDRCVLAQLELSHAASSSDYTAASAAVEAMIASKAVSTPALVPILNTLGKNQYNAKNYAGAAQSFERAISFAPNDPEQLMLLAETRAKMGQTDAALSTYRKVVAAYAASGTKIPEDYVKHAVAFAYNGKSPQLYDLAREWARSYPTEKNWRDAIMVYTAQSDLPTSDLIDMWRLQRATGALAGETDYGLYAQTALDKGLVGEAKAVLEEGIASKKLARGARIASLLGQANAKAAGDRASLTAGAAKALASATANPAVNTADALFGYGDYAKAAELYRAALTKTGADQAQINLRLGMALAMSGD